MSFPIGAETSQGAQMTVGTPDPRDETSRFPGLTSLPRSQWPRIAVEPQQRPIDMMKPGSVLHARIKDHLKKRLSDSERAMTKFHGRWRANEMRHQAWLNLNDFERILKDANERGAPPKAVNITIPYSFATLQTISTYMLQVFGGRKPYLQVGTYGPHLENAMRAEIVLQYQNDHNRVLRHWWQWFNDMSLYGVGIVVAQWEIDKQMRTRKSQRPVFDISTGAVNMEDFREQQEEVVYEGNKIQTLDPFMFYPDPRVPMHQVAEKGEFVFWRKFTGKHTLKKEEASGRVKWVDAAPQSIAHTVTGQMLSARALLSGGEPHAGGPWDWQLVSGSGYYSDDTCSIEIIPRELGIGHSEKVEKWMFRMLNGEQIISAEPLLEDHGEHPVVVAEPYTMGYSFGAMGMSDMVAPLQDSMSWFLNAHMDNVRRVINDMIVVDPNVVEMQDVKRPGPGKIIRLKKAALNRDVRTAVNQLNVQDVTRGHIDSMNVFFEIGQRISAVSENLLGLQDSGGRKTATEVRTASEAAASRLAAITRVASAQGMTALTRQMLLNSQQWMSREFYTRVVGPEGNLFPLTVTPDGIAGDFYYPVHDGTLPLDRIARLDIWREILVGVLQDPQLRQSYSVPKLFEFVAELGGANNIKSFRIQAMPEDQLNQQAQAGNLAPIPGANGPAGLMNSTLPQPGNRIVGAGGPA